MSVPNWHGIICSADRIHFQVLHVLDSQVICLPVLTTLPIHSFPSEIIFDSHSWLCGFYFCPSTPDLVLSPAALVQLEGADSLQAFPSSVICSDARAQTTCPFLALLFLQHSLECRMSASQRYIILYSPFTS